MSAIARFLRMPAFPKTNGHREASGVLGIDRISGMSGLARNAAVSVTRLYGGSYKLARILRIVGVELTLGRYHQLCDVGALKRVFVRFVVNFETNR
jgi:hypothetical protein